MSTTKGASISANNAASNPADVACPTSNYSDLPLKDVLVQGRHLGFHERTALFSRYYRGLFRHEPMGAMFFRRVLSPTDREVLVRNHDGTTQRMLMFGSNSYLGLPTHPYVQERVRASVAEHGAGMGGPPMLNGYYGLHRTLEERLAALEGTEECVLFGSGYSTNVGLMSALPSSRDTVLYDDSSHASFIDGVKLGGHRTVTFEHNNAADLEAKLVKLADAPGERFVGVEGVYSMDGDLAPLDEISAVCKRLGAFLIVDDAHGTGVTGGGRGTARHFGVHDDVDLVMGTFSKAFASSGGFVACTAAVADYLRLTSRAYVFSASLSPTTVAAILAGLDVLEQEPELHQRLLDNAAYLAAGLQRLGFADAHGDSAVFSLPVEQTKAIRPMAFAFHQRGFFLNHVEFPAVKPSAQRFRISVMANHTREDLDLLLAVIEEVWTTFSTLGDGAPSAPVYAFPDRTLDIEITRVKTPAAPVPVPEELQRATSRTSEHQD